MNKEFDNAMLRAMMRLDEMTEDFSEAEKKLFTKISTAFSDGIVESNITPQRAMDVFRIACDIHEEVLMDAKIGLADKMKEMKDKWEM